jgi:hypothetical protein
MSSQSPKAAPRGTADAAATPKPPDSAAKPWLFTANEIPMPPPEMRCPPGADEDATLFERDEA